MDDVWISTLSIQHSKMLFKTFPKLQTTRLHLRQFKASDVDLVYYGLSHPEVIQYYGVSYDSLEATEQQMEWFEKLWNERTGLWWAICLHGADTLIGGCGFNNYEEVHRKAEIGYWLLPTSWSKGYASEAVKAAIHFGFYDLNLIRIEAYLESENENSRHLLQKLGFDHEGTMRNCEYKNDRFIDVDIYARLRE